jgi:prepilin-type N-terminal cleavage/methylation domain-containing protein
MRENACTPPLTGFLKGEKGFTLIELIIVVAIGAILGATAVPDFLGLSDRARLKSAARDVASAMQQARISAIRNATAWAIDFDVASGQYRILSSDGGDGTWGDGNEPVYKTIALPGDATVAFGTDYADRPGEPNPGATDGVSFTDNRVVFGTDGTSITGTVYLKNDDGDSFAVGASSIAGSIKLWRNYGSGWGV